MSMFVPAMHEQINKTKVLPFVYGRFGVEQWKIPYFSLTMELRDAAEFLTLTPDLPGENTQEFEVEELFQRDIDWKRVERDIAPYLLESGQPQFFGALTVVMLPYSSRAKQIVHSFGADEPWQAPDLDADYPKSVQVGPIRLGFFNDFDQFGDANSLQGRMAWNLDQAFAVAIDGQHRLAAMKEVKQVISNDPTHPLGRVRVPVNVLIFDSAVGFSSPNAVDADNVRLMRKIFIDVNKHAAKVKRARQLLLDDNSAQAICLRRLIAGNLSGDVSTEAGGQSPISLALVNWHSEEAKFDKGPYVSTILSLDSLLTIALQAPGSDRPTDWTAAGNQLRKLRVGLQIPLEKAGQALELARDHEKPFIFPPSELAQVGASFGAAWVPAFRRILLGYAPYAALVSKRKQTGSFSLEWQIWYRLWAAAEASHRTGRALQELERFESELANREDNPMLIRPMNGLREDLDVMKDNSLAFAVVFQKSLFMAFVSAKSYRTKLFNSFPLTENQQRRVAEAAALGGQIQSDVNELEEDLRPMSKIDLLVDLEEELDDPQEVQASKGAIALGLEQEVFAEIYVEALNAILSAWPTFLERNTTGPDGAHDAVYFWDGSLLRDDQINFTDAAAKRAASLLEILFLMYSLKKSSKSLTFETIWDSVTAEVAPSDALLRELRKLVQAAYTKDWSVGHMILSRRNIPWTDENRDEARKEVRERLSRAFKAIDKACK